MGGQQESDNKSQNSKHSFKTAFADCGVGQNIVSKPIESK